MKMKECNKTRIKQVVGYTFELIGVMITIMILPGYLRGYSVRMSTDLYGLLDYQMIFSWTSVYVVAIIISICIVVVDEYRGKNE